MYEVVSVDAEFCFVLFCFVCLDKQCAVYIFISEGLKCFTHCL